MLLRNVSPRGRSLVASARIQYELTYARCEADRILGVLNYHAALASHEFTGPHGRRRYHWQSRGQSLEHHEPTWLVARGEDEHITGPHDPPNVTTITEKMHP